MDRAQVGDDEKDGAQALHEHAGLWPRDDSSHLSILAPRFAAEAGFEGVRPYALRHTFATLNLANGENIKTVAVLMGHASSAYTLDLYAAYVPNTGIGIGTRYMNFLRAAA